MKCSDDVSKNIAKAEGLVREAAKQGSRIILLQELFSTLYFCQKEKAEFLRCASELEESSVVRHFQKLASELGVVLPVSFYEKKNNALYNSLALIDADGTLLGVYRKSHIPTGPGYEEKFYFNPGDTGFKVWNTKYGKIGAGICWDQWFPEAARCMALLGAEILLYPTAIGSEPENPSIDSKAHWQRCMTGHSACNMLPVVVSNRTGIEAMEGSSVNFYGSSFITDVTGEIIKEAGRDEETLISAEFDLDECRARRIEWGLFRDRRPELYGVILTNDGEKNI
jgi:N-carbamoylputrescine amidase